MVSPQTLWADYLHEVEPKPRFYASSGPYVFSMRWLFSLINVLPLLAFGRLDAVYKIKFSGKRLSEIKDILERGFVKP